MPCADDAGGGTEAQDDEGGRGEVTRMSCRASGALNNCRRGCRVRCGALHKKYIEIDSMYSVA
jgi:hypothetical protein